MSNNMVPVVLNETDDYFNSMPPGFRFVPTDEVLILCYLRKKLLNEPLPINRIRHVNIYQYHPRDLTAMYDLLRESEWYYFTPITRKYVNSSRPNRVAPNGFWKPRMSNPIKDRNNEVVGYRTSLEFYEGKYPNGNKTGWKMNEYTINEAIIPPNINTNGKTRIKLDDCVLCKIFTLKVARKLQNEIQYQLENPIGRNKATSTSIVGPSNTTTTTGDQLPVHDAMEHEPHSNHEVQQDGSSDSKHEEDDDGWLIIGVESLNISSDPMIEGDFGRHN